MQAHQTFLTHCCDHAFFNGFPRLLSAPETIAIPLRLAIACLASVQGRKNENEGQNLFMAGMSLWAVLLEVDNREAQSLEMLLAVRTSSQMQTTPVNFS